MWPSRGIQLFLLFTGMKTNRSLVNRKRRAVISTEATQDVTFKVKSGLAW